MDGYRVRPEALVEAAAAARQVSTQLTGARTTLGRRGESLFADGWTGTAAASFAAALKEWDEGAVKVAHAVDLMGEAIAAASREFVRTDESRSVATLGAGEGLPGESGLNL